jgi:peptide/nickel transport system permease protein
MVTYTIRRLFQAVVIILLVTMIVFSVIRYLPGDPVLAYISRDAYTSSSPAEIAKLRHDFGLDQPIHVQYVHWLGDVFRGDLGMSIMFRSSVNDEIAKALPKTLYMGAFAFAFSILLGIPLGIIAAIRRGKWPDTLSTILANIGITAPVFWIGIILILVFGLYLKWLPTFGFVSPFDDLWGSIRSIIMPVICITMYPLAAIARQTRSSMLEVIRQDYIRTAWSRGFNERQVILEHALKNSIIPIMTLIGLNMRVIFGGQVLVETVFNISGMGRLSVDAIFNQDYAVLQGVILVVSSVIVLSSLLVDLSYGWIDPKIHYE